MKINIHGGADAPIRLQLIGKNGAGKDASDESNNFSLLITGGDVGKGEAVEIELSSTSVADLQVIASNPRKSTDEHDGPSLEIVAGGGGNFKRIPAPGSTASADVVLVCDIVAGGGGN